MLTKLGVLGSEREKQLGAHPFQGLNPLRS